MAHRIITSPLILQFDIKIRDIPDLRTRIIELHAPLRHRIEGDVQRLELRSFHFEAGIRSRCVSPNGALHVAQHLHLIYVVSLSPLTVSIRGTEGFHTVTALLR